jgi:hypothetical protein
MTKKGMLPGGQAMKRILAFSSLLMIFVLPFVGSGRPSATETSKPGHAVLFIIDGLSSQAVEKISLPNLNKLISEGSYFKESYNIIPAHPRQGEWAKLHRSSIPNPVILAGTVLLLPDQKYVQHSFFPKHLTAHAANDLDYTELDSGINLTFIGGTGAAPVQDDQAISWALEFMRKGRPAYMRVHLQDTGRGGVLSFRAADPSLPWYRNIWADESPYRKAAAKADECLGLFLAGLEAAGLKDKTILFVTSDHGQADSGWHPPEDKNAWVMPLVLAGPGIRHDQTFDHAEQVDIVPTLCYLMGVEPPPNADGRILAEALVSPPADAPPPQLKIRELNALLVEGAAVIDKLRRTAESSASLKERLAQAEKDFFGIERILEWHQFKTVDGLLAHNRSVLDQISAPPPLPNTTHLP